MAIALYMDVHVPQAITEQLRRRGIDVLTTFEDRTTKLPVYPRLSKQKWLASLLSWER